MLIKNNIQRGIKLKYLQKKLDSAHNEIEKLESRQNTVDVNLRQQKQLKDSLIDRMMDLEIEMNSEGANTQEVN